MYPMNGKIESCTTSAPEDCVMININVENIRLRGMMDSGASRLIIDLGTLELLGQSRSIVKNKMSSYGMRLTIKWNF